MGVMDMINSFIHPERSYKDAQKENQAGWDQSQGYQKPYWQNGIDQTPKLTGAEDKLLNPVALQDEWSKGYENSAYAKQLLEQNKTSGLDAASSMGLNGSSAALNNIQTGAGNIVSKDRQQYMDDLMKKYMNGIGIGKDIYGRGADAGTNLGRGAQQFGESSAQTKYGEKSAPGALLERLMNLFMNQGSNVTSSIAGAGGGAGGAGGASSAAAMVA